MDVKTGYMVRMAEEQAEAFEKINRTKLIRLTDSQAKELIPLNPRQRKNCMRNKPCPCGSGRKYKKCCWNLS